MSVKQVALALFVVGMAACGGRPVPVVLPPGTDAEIAETERLGRTILAHDTAASRATDELIRIGVVPSNEIRALGWITVPGPEGIAVRFVGEENGQYVALYDVTFAPDDAPLAKRLSPAEPLPPAQVAAFDARQLAIANTTLDCSDRYNTVVFQDPVGAGDDWHVYLFPATTVPGRIMVGRVLRLLISPDGKRVVENGALSKDCMYIDRSTAPAGAEPQALWLTNLLTPTPNESHVFLSLREELPIAVGTSLGAWMVSEGRIGYLGPTNGDPNSP
jgi:hypothetical protein